MINYTDRLTFLMQDIGTRLEPLRFIDVSEVLIFARFGRRGTDGPIATCHCVNMPTTEPGYYFWRDRSTGELTRRSQLFVTKSPEVYLGPKRIKYLISFALPRFCDQTLERSRKAGRYPESDAWIAKLDTVIHELYHIDPRQEGIRRMLNPDGTTSDRMHGREFYDQVAGMVRGYLDSGPDPAVYDFLRQDFAALSDAFGGIVGTTFRNFPSFPQRYSEALEAQPCDSDIEIVAVKQLSQPTRYTEDDLLTRQFLASGVRRLTRKGQHRAA
jgi:hypothetical protein